MSKIVELQIIFQKPIEEDMVPYIEDLYKERVFATQGQTEVYKYVRTSNDTYVENFLVIRPVSIPTGIPGMKDVVRAAVKRTMEEVEWDPAWLMFYVIAKFERDKGPDAGTTLFRTIIPRTEVPVQLRRIRRRNIRRRKPGTSTRRRVRRK